MGEKHQWEEERQRIRAAYLRRRERGLDRGEYLGHEDAAHVLRLQDRYRHTLAALAHHGVTHLAGKEILDVGCGVGVQLLEYLQWGADPHRLYGIDLRREAIELAQTRLPAAVLRIGCATDLPWQNDSFDLVSQQTVFSSILDRDMRTQVAREMTRVLAPRGLILWYDAVRANPRNPDVRPVGRRELGRLFPDFEVVGRRLTFLPHVARRIPAGLLGLGYSVLSKVPGGRCHLLALLQRRNDD